MPSESILARKGFATLVTAERLDTQMNTFVALEIMVAIKALNTLVALEGAVDQGQSVLEGISETGSVARQIHFRKTMADLRCRIVSR